jgi:hypothetical protein
MLPQLAGLVLAAVAYRAPAQGTPPLQPATYQSPTGEWALEVDPTSRFGAGPATCRMLRDGKPVWIKHVAFTLRGVSIDERGYAAGHAYDQGWTGRPDGNFVLVVLSPSGEIVGQHAWPLHMGRELHGSAKPWVRESILDAARGAVVFRTETSEGQDSFEEWIVLELEGGRLLDRYRPDERAQVARLRGAQVIDMLPIPKTPLHVVSWRTSIDPDDSSAKDLCIAALDPDGKPVATLALPKALDVASRSGRNLWQEMWRRGNLLPVEHDEGFAVWLPNSALRVDYGVKQLPGDSQWMIEELDRTPYEPPEEPLATDPPNEPIELRLLERVQLLGKQRPEPGAIRDIVALGFDGRGGFQAIRCDDSDRFVFTNLLLDERGEVRLERPIAPFGRPHKWQSLGAGRWLVTAYGDADRTPAIVVESTGELSPCRVADSDFSKLREVLATPDGGLVVLGTRAGIGYSWSSAVARYDAAGTRLWLTILGRSEDRDPLSDADGLCVCPSGLVVAVDEFHGVVGVIEPDGDFVATLKLAELWDHAPHVEDIQPDGNEGFLVVENRNSPVVRRVGLDGRIRSSFVPRHPDGSKDAWLARNVRRAPDGRLWTFDFRSLLRLSDDGTADLVLGQSRDSEYLDYPSTGFVDPLGCIAMLDGPTRVLHVFDRSGSLLHTAAPRPGDFEGNSDELDVSGSFAGDHFIKSTALAGGWLAFDGEGKRLGETDLGTGRRDFSSVVSFAPSNSFWVCGYEDNEAAILRDRELQELGRIDRRDDRRWFEDLEGLAVAPSGSVAVLESLPFTGQGELYTGRGTALAWFDVHGKPIGHLVLSNSSANHLIAYSGEWIAVASYTAEGIWLASTHGKGIKRFTPPPEWSAGLSGVLGVSPDGRELWLVQPSERVLWRFALP